MGNRTEVRELGLGSVLRLMSSVLDDVDFEVKGKGETTGVKNPTKTTLTSLAEAV